MINLTNAKMTSNEDWKDIKGPVTEQYENLFMLLEPILYKWRSDSPNSSDTKIHIGFGAQTTARHIEEVGLNSTDSAMYYSDVYEDYDGNKTYDIGLNYTEIANLGIYMLQKALLRIWELENRVAELEAAAK